MPRLSSRLSTETQTRWRQSTSPRLSLTARTRSSATNCTTYGTPSGRRNRTSCRSNTTRSCCSSTPPSTWARRLCFQSTSCTIWKLTTRSVCARCSRRRRRGRRTWTRVSWTWCGCPCPVRRVPAGRWLTSSTRRIYWASRGRTGVRLSRRFSCR